MNIIENIASGNLEDAKKTILESLSEKAMESLATLKKDTKVDSGSKKLQVAKVLDMVKKSPENKE